MGLLSTPPANDDPKRQAGAYLVLGERHMYEVIEANDDGTVQAKNCQTGYVYRLTVTNLKRARLVQPLRDAEMETFEAAYDATPSIPDA